jgi:hypothetical protein
MDDAEKALARPPQPVGLRTWIPSILGPIVLIAFHILMHTRMLPLTPAYSHLKITQRPILTSLALAVGYFLWMVLLAVCTLAGAQLVRGKRESALYWLRRVVPLSAALLVPLLYFLTESIPSETPGVR